MEPQTAHIFRFGPFCLEIEDRLLLEHGRAVPLTPKAFDTLVALVRRNGRVVKKEDLLSEVWPNTFVEEATLAQNVFTLRKALGQTAGGAQYIETIPKQGYRFVADVEEISGDDAELLFQTTTRTHIVSEELEHSDAPNTHITESPYRSNVVVSPEARFESISPSFPRDAITGEVPPRPSGRHLQPWLTLAIIPVLALVAVSYWRFKKPESNPVSQIFSNGNIKLAKVTSTGTISEAAISQDGKYVAYVQFDREGQSLWVKQTSSSRAIKVTEPGNVKYQGLTFTPDGTSIYYAVYEKTSINGIVYEVPTLGGASRKVSFDVDSPPSFAPDGKRFAFVRNEAGFKESSLIISEAETGREKKLVSIPGYAPFSMEGPAWSPDGKAIVIPTHIGDANRSKWILLAFDPETGEKVPFESHEWDAIGQTAWLPEGRGLVFVGRDKPNSLFLNQLWQISFPGGQAQSITNDLNTYTGVAVAFSPPSLLTIQSDRVANFYLAPKTNLEKPVQVTSGRGDKPSEVMGLSWTPDNKIVYGSSASGNIQIWMMDP
jgi:DNA-binding winged helix-turn-helix (wHTH) protein/Tol biopolymer transport system component